MQDAGYGLPRTPLLASWVNKAHHRSGSDGPDPLLRAWPSPPEVPRDVSFLGPLVYQQLLGFNAESIRELPYGVRMCPASAVLVGGDLDLVNSRPLVEVPKRPQLLQAQPAELSPVNLHWGVLNVVSTSATSTALGVFSKASNLTNYFPSWLGYKRRRTTVAGGDESAMNPRG
jgi:hypothetical protein